MINQKNGIYRISYFKILNYLEKNYYEKEIIMKKC